jgi:hypothetical protein
VTYVLGLSKEAPPLHPIPIPKLPSIHLAKDEKERNITATNKNFFIKDLLFYIL